MISVYELPLPQFLRDYQRCIQLRSVRVVGKTTRLFNARVDCYKWLIQGLVETVAYMD